MLFTSTKKFLKINLPLFSLPADFQKQEHNFENLWRRQKRESEFFKILLLKKKKPFTSKKSF